ncbi:hypothetical protein BDN72DRAFT_850903 [Pluteus cervinus]|uniref:Uncharacterized protein n=1 Tax=Pluteus cervinus TaxID=181527 RepID=A0ACD3A2U6_9AGAR|nr:hypothetical protein BDN72DRAFT_850903 [Pluteus cervinus]
MYLNKLFHPYAPERAGAPGLFFNIYKESNIPKKGIVFTRFEANRWCYMGFYELRPTQSLTKEEWSGQTEKVQASWANLICGKKWGYYLRSRILLRNNLGREPTEEEVEVESKKNRFHSVSPVDVKKAYLDGDEAIAVWTMQCTGYNAAFQCNLIKNSQGGSKRKADDSETEDVDDDDEAAGPSRKKRRGSNTSSQIQPSEDRGSSERMDVDIDSDGQEEAEVMYHPRVTRSRHRARVSSERSISPEL